MSNSTRRALDHFLIISLLALLVFLTQYSFRYLDDNRLTSWQWVFTTVDVADIFLLLIIGLIIAYILSISSLPESRPALFLFFASFSICLFFWTEPEVIVDVSRYFTQAKHLSLYGIRYFLIEWGMGIDAWTDMPLVPFLYGLIFKYLGESRIFIQLFTTSLFSMTVVLTYLIGKTLWDQDTGFYGGLLLLGMPYLFTQVPLMLVDVPTMFFLTLSLFTFIKALKTGGVWVILSSITILLAILSKYSTLLMLTVLIIIFLIFLKEDLGPKGYKLLVGSSVFRRATMIELIAGIGIGVITLLKFDVISGQLSLLLDYQRPALKRWGESLISTFFYQLHPFVTIGAIYSFFIALKKRDIRYLVISWFILLILFLRIRRARYTLIVFPMFALMASYGLKGFKDQRLKRFFSYTTVVFSTIVALFAYLPFLERMAPANLKDAGEFLNSHNIEEVEVITIPSKENTINPAVTVPILDLFFKGDIYYHNKNIPPPFEMIKMSPLRFTWEYEYPEYYTYRGTDLHKDMSIVIISNRHPQVLPDRLMRKVRGFNKIIDFEKKTGFFRYTPLIRIYY